MHNCYESSMYMEDAYCSWEGITGFFKTQFHRKNRSSVTKPIVTHLHTERFALQELLLWWDTVVMIQQYFKNAQVNRKLYPGCTLAVVGREPAGSWGIQMRAQAGGVQLPALMCLQEQELNSSMNQALCLSWGSHFWGFCFVLNLCCWKRLHRQRKKSVTLGSGSWTGEKAQGKFHGTDQTCTTRSCTKRLFR